MPICVFCEVETTNRDYRCDLCKLKLTYSKITPNLYLSDYDRAKNYPLVKALGIKQILTIGGDMPHSTDLKNLVIGIDDNPNVNIVQYFDVAHKFISRAPTLVHCQMGISRSPTIIISYLMKKYGMSLYDALAHCKKARPIVNPNRGFIAQLVEYDIYLRPIMYPEVVESNESNNLEPEPELMFQLD